MIWSRPSPKSRRNWKPLVSDEVSLASPKLKGWLDGLGGLEKRQTRWLTPNWIVESLGEFDLDPCGAPDHELAKKTYLLENGDDGLRDPWFGRCFVNPPYGKEAEAFLKKLKEHGNGIALIFARTETKSFFDNVWHGADAILFIRGRLTFIDADKVAAKANSGAPSCLVAYGVDNVKALYYSGIPGRLVSVPKTIEVIAHGRTS